MSYQPDIIPNSPTGQALQASIQKQLALQGWSTEDDAVMAEYCLVMLGNKKTPDQISLELSDLIGSDFDPSFVSWLFTELVNHYPDPSSSSSQPPSHQQQEPQQQQQPVSSINVISDSRSPRAPRRGEVFGAAVGGLKRDADSINGGGGGGRDNPPSQRPRFDNRERNGGAGFDGVPSGPRNGDRGGRGGRGGGGGDRSIFDRVQGNGPQFAPTQHNQFDPVQNAIDTVTRSAPPVLSLSQQQQQFQAQTMAMAQAFAAMQQQWAPNAAGAGFSGVVPFQQPFPQQGFQPFPTPQFPPPPHFQPPPHHQNNNQQKPRNQKHNKPVTAAAPAVTAAAKLVPTKPLEEEICKHGVDCSKPTCPYSHPSPVATKDSGLVLSSVACEKGLECVDPDCPKSHVSPSQLRPPPPQTLTPFAQPFTPAVQGTPAGAGEKSCKFAGSCTRADCVFLHPWDVKGDPAGGSVGCRWGVACTRADCHFSHPPSRPTPASYKKPPHNSKPFFQQSTPQQTYSKSSYSTTFVNPANPPIGAWPSEKPTHVSDRLKRFNLEDGGGGEKIIPGGEKKEEGEGKVEVESEKEGKAE